MGSVNGASRAGVWLLLVGGLALAVSTFLDWYDFLGAGVSAWDALRGPDVAIFCAGGGAGAARARRLVRVARPRGDLALGAAHSLRPGPPRLGGVGGDPRRQPSR